MCYNQFVRGGEPVCDHDASLRRWMQRSRMLTALADEITSLNKGVFYYIIYVHTRHFYI